MDSNQNQFKCTGNCLNCLPAQRAYCASQHAYSNMKVLDMMMKEILSIKEEMNSISQSIEELQNEGYDIFDPTERESGNPVNATAQ